MVARAPNPEELVGRAFQIMRQMFRIEHSRFLFRDAATIARWIKL
jgi:hypothetical protein